MHGENPVGAKDGLLEIGAGLRIVLEGLRWRRGVEPGDERRMATGEGREVALALHQLVVADEV